MPTASNPHISADDIEAARREMTEASFNQEFLAAFVNWDGSVFRHVQDCVTASPQSQRIEGHTYAIGYDWGRSLDF